MVYLHGSVLSSYIALLQGRILDVLLEEGDRELRSAMLTDAFTPPEAGSSAGGEVLREVRTLLRAIAIRQFRVPLKQVQSL